MRYLILFLLSISIANADVFVNPTWGKMGASISGNYYTSAGSPAGWYVIGSDKLRYRGEATLYFSGLKFRFALQTYMEGDGSPALGGLKAAVGWKFKYATISLFHHSCHNLDNAPQYAEMDGNYYAPLQPVPPCQFNGIKARTDFGTTFQPLW